MSAVAALGVHVSAGVAWLGSASSEGELVLNSTDRLEAEIGGLSLGRSFSEFEEGFEALLRRLEPGCVALLDAGKSRHKLKVSTSLRRGAVEALVTLAAFRADTALRRVTHDQVEKALGHRPSHDSLATRLAKGLEEQRPARWKDRVPAFAAALTVIRGD